MNLLIPSSKITRQKHPCPHCQTPTPVDVITNIESEEDFANFMAHGLNGRNASAAAQRWKRRCVSV